MQVRSLSVLSFFLICLGMVSCGKMARRINKETVDRQKTSYKLKAEKPKVLDRPKELKTLAETEEKCQVISQAIILFQKYYLPELNLKTQPDCHSDEESYKTLFALERHKDVLHFSLQVKKKEIKDPDGKLIEEFYDASLYVERGGSQEIWDPTRYPNLMHINLSHIQSSLSEWLKSSRTFWTPWLCFVKGRKYNENETACVIDRPQIVDQELANTTLLKTDLAKREEFLHHLAQAVMDALLKETASQWHIVYEVKETKRTELSEKLSQYDTELVIRRDPAVEENSELLIVNSLSLIWSVQVAEELSEKDAKIVNSLVHIKGSDQAWDHQNPKITILHPQMIHLPITLAAYLPLAEASSNSSEEGGGESASFPLLERILDGQTISIEERKKINLAGIDFSVFVEEKCANAPFRDSCLSRLKSRFSFVDFSQLNLKNARFFDFDLSGTKFEGANLDGARFVKSILDQTSFKSRDDAPTHLSNVLFKEVSLKMTDFSGSDISQVIFYNCQHKDTIIGGNR